MCTDFDVKSQLVLHYIGCLTHVQSLQLCRYNLHYNSNKMHGQQMATGRTGATATTLQVSLIIRLSVEARCTEKDEQVSLC